MHIHGTCHCKAISFTATVDPTKVLACHCDDCQKMTGAPYRTVVPAMAQNVQMTGSPKHYIKTAQSGNRRDQVFCGTCGTHLYATDPDNPEIFGLRVGAIDERASLPPHLHIWCSSAMTWITDLKNAPWFSQGPASALFTPK